MEFCRIVVMLTHSATQQDTRLWGTLRLFQVQIVCFKGTSIASQENFVA